MGHQEILNGIEEIDMNPLIEKFEEPSTYEDEDYYEKTK